MKIRDVVLRLHRWAGLAVGAVVTLLSLTGAALLVSAPRDSESPGTDGRATPAGRPPLPVSSLIATAAEAVPHATPRSIRLARAPRSAEVQFRDNTTVLIDPWDGSVIEVREEGATVTGWLTHFHETLLLGRFGRLLVGLSTIVFLGLLPLGLWLWWPTTRSVRRAFLVQPGSGLKRLNYDAHNVLGFYAALVLFVLGGTGVMFAYPGLQALGGRLANALGPAPVPAEAAPPDGADELPLDSTPPTDRAWAAARNRFPEAPWQRLAFGRGDPPALRVAVGVGEGTHAGRFHAVRFNPRGELTAVMQFGQEPAAVRLSRLVGELHTGTLSDAYRVVAFLACLVGATLPITGALIWFPRWRRRRRGVVNARRAEAES